MNEQCQQCQHRDDLELHLLPAMRQLLWQRMQFQVEDADADDGDNDKDGRGEKNPSVCPGEVIKAGKC